MLIAFLFLALMVTGAIQNANAQDLVPIPRHVTWNSLDSGFKFDKKFFAKIPADQPDWNLNYIWFSMAARQLNPNAKFEQHDDDGIPTALIVTKNDDLANEAYKLFVDSKSITIEASDIKGFAHATATLLQLIGQAKDNTIAAVEIEDQPGCQYRSFMVDVGRNPHSLECLKDTIDLLWFYKVDSLHLHLTDDQLFAFPSKAFPKLLSDRGKITWDEFAELENYARQRGVTIIPELEVPGHSTLLRKHYPDVFGKTSTDLATNKKSRDAIKVLLDEVIELFPSSPFIHIGGDEAYGVPVDIQRDLINELHAHLKSKGKQTIVWEGPGLGKGDNKVNEEVIHINWRTINFPADKMLEAGYPVVNAAWDPLYIVDHYPRNNFTMVSPEHTYTKLDLYRFAHYNPGIPTFAKPIMVDKESESAKRLIGFCMPWWEGREENYFPMIVPRLIPMAEVAWNPNQKRDYPTFDKRVKNLEAIRARGFYPITITASPMVLESEGVFHNETTITLEKNEIGEIMYSLDPNQSVDKWQTYTGPFTLNKSAVLRAGLFTKGLDGHFSRKTFVMVEPVENLALGKSVTASVSSGPLFTPARLTDGGTGNLDYFLGYPAEPKPIEITIDLEAETEFNQIIVHTFFNNNAYESYEVQVSKDGTAFTRVAERFKKPDKPAASITHEFEKQNARYVRIVTRGCKSNVFDSFSRLTEVQVFMKGK
ncbi:MAG: family 20 glycosylhydrolase [Mariniblastus sp.]